MPIFSKTPDEMFLDIVNGANSELPVKLDFDKIALLRIVNYVRKGEPQNTRALLTSTLSQDFKDDTYITWTRLAISTLMRGTPIVIQHFFRTIVGAQFNTLITDLHELLPLINKKYGLNITSTDVYNARILRGGRKLPSGRYYAEVKMTFLPRNTMYTGSITVRWEDTKPSIDQITTSAKLGSLTWLGGNDFDNPARKPNGEWPTYGINFTKDGAWLDELDPSIVRRIVARVNDRLGYAYLNESNHTVKGGIAGLTFMKYSLPNDAALPFANASDYNRVLVLNAQSSSWFKGRMYFHYNL